MLDVQQNRVKHFSFYRLERERERFWFGFRWVRERQNPLKPCDLFFFTKVTKSSVEFKGEVG